MAGILAPRSTGSVCKGITWSISVFSSCMIRHKWRSTCLVTTSNIYGLLCKLPIFIRGGVPQGHDNLL